MKQNGVSSYQDTVPEGANDFQTRMNYNESQISFSWKGPQRSSCSNLPALGNDTFHLGSWNSIWKQGRDSSFMSSFGEAVAHVKVSCSCAHIFKIPVMENWRTHSKKLWAPSLEKCPPETN